MEQSHFSLLQKEEVCFLIGKRIQEPNSTDKLKNSTRWEEADRILGLEAPHGTPAPP